MQKFDQVLFYGGAYENGSAKSVFEFRFSNTEENSLKQLFDIFSSITEEKEKMWQDDIMMMDTAIMVDSTMAMDTAVMMPVAMIAPNFKDAEVQKFATEYAAFVNEYITLMRSKDMEKLAAWSSKASAIGERSQSISAKVANDPQESKKLSDWLIAVSEHLSKSVENITMTDEEVDIPPPPPPKSNPPKVEMKKTTTPPKKKN
jgi:hypothetical protein